MFDSLSQKFGAIFSRLTGKGRITERNVADACEEVRMALLEADVNYRVARDFVKRVREAAVGEEVLRGVDPAQQFVKIVHDELVGLLGPTEAQIRYNQSGPTVIMMAGLQGSGKTTTAAKMAVRLRKEGRNPMLVAADVQRPAAVEQLKVLGNQVDVPVHSEKGASPPDICGRAAVAAGLQGCDVIILDTAGRLHIDEDLMEELVEIARRTRPQEVLLVCDAMTGQDAVNSAREFNDRLEISGVVLTKLDGDARGGAALSVKAVTGKTIRFVGVGEKMKDLEPFHPDRMAGRILGMGDVVTLVEKAQETIDQEEALKMQERLLSAQFTLEDLLNQFRQVKKMGSLSDVLGMIPGLGQQFSGANIDDRELARFEAMISSMTKEERSSPEIIDVGRRRRVAAGSGTTPNDVGVLLKQYREMRKMFSGKGRFAGMLQGLVPGLGAGGTSRRKKALDRRQKAREQRKKRRRKKRRH